MNSAIEDRVQIPSWLTEIYLQKVLRKTYSNDLEVLSFTAFSPVAPGNNYASLILRVQAQCLENGTQREHSIIVKTIPSNDENARMVGEHGAHIKETKIYSNYLPRIQSLLESIGDKDKIAPLVIFVDANRQALIFEDMKSTNYQMANRKVGLDWDHMKIVLRKLAKFHACSVIIAEQKDEYEDFQKSIFEGFDRFFTRMFEELGEEITHWTGFEKYGRKLMEMSNFVIPQAIKAFKTKPGDFRVLCHGDCWTSNLLFKYDDQGLVEDSCLIDFQLPVYASPVCDLIYFFFTSANDEVKFDYKKNHEMLQLYHKYLTEALVQLKSKTKPPTLFELHQDFHARSIIGVIFTVMLPPILNENEKDADLQNLIGDSDTAKAFRKEMFALPRTIATLKQFLPLFDMQGLLDPLK